VASMVAAKDLISEILMALIPKQFKILKWFLQSTFFHMGLPQLPWSQLVLADRVEIVDQLVRLCGRQSVEVAAEVLTDMNICDLARRLSEGYPRQKGGNSVSFETAAGQNNNWPERRGASGVQDVTAVKEEDFSKILLETLDDFDLRDLDKFRWLLQFTCFRRSVPQIPKNQLEHANSPHRLIHLMVERLGQRSLEVAREVLTDMNRRDLLKKLPETSAESKGNYVLCYL
ncbi:hypothetical protein GOODEAATRI_028619, partial [Goodea atripinnis]